MSRHEINHTDRNTARPGQFILIVAFLMSGSTALIFEVIWTRLMLLSLGGTALAVGVVLAAFMGGMAVGSVLAGKNYFLRFDPVLLYAVLEAWIGIYSLTTPSLFRAVAGLPTILQFTSDVLIMLPATTAMGASLPFLARAIGHGTFGPGVKVGYLYAANTFGAVLGPLLAVFIIFPACGLRITLLFTAGLNLLIFAGLLTVYRMGFLGQKRTVTGTHVVDSDRPHKLLLTALAVSGATAMVYEIAWARTLSMVYGSSIYGVTIMLATFLLGLAGGSALASTYLKRKRMNQEVSLATIAWLLAGSAVSAYVSLYITHLLPSLFVKLYCTFPEYDVMLFVTQFVIAIPLMLPATLCLGAMLPVATDVGYTSHSEPGRHVSRLYTANLVGSTLGALLASGLMIGHFGIEQSVRMSAGVALIVSLTALLKKQGLRFSPAAIGFLLGGLLVVTVFFPHSASVQKGYSFYSDPRAYENFGTSEFETLMDAYELLYYRDGSTATVSVLKLDPYLLLDINGKTDASNGPGDLNTQILLGQLPLLITDAQHVAIIGWGSGITAGAVLTHPVRKVDAYEIEPAVIEASRFFDDYNGSPLSDPRLELIIGDARSKLGERSGPYDVIVSEPSNPWLTGVANLFTEDFFQLVASRLKPEGIVSQWFHLYGMSVESTRSLIATFQSVFPYTFVFKDRDLILVGSKRPFSFDLQRIERIMEQPSVAENLAQALITYPTDIIALLRLDQKAISLFTRGAPLNTDDNMLLELAAPRSLYRDKLEDLQTTLAQYPPSVAEHVVGYASRAELFQELAASYLTAGYKEKALRASQTALASEESFFGYKLQGQILQSLGRADEARVVLKRALALGGNEEEQRFVQALLNTIPE